MLCLAIATITLSGTMASAHELPGLALELNRIRPLPAGVLPKHVPWLDKQLRISDEGHRLWWEEKMIDTKTGQFTNVHMSELATRPLEEYEVPVFVGTWQSIPESWARPVGLYRCNISTTIADRGERIAFLAETDYRFLAGLEGVSIKHTLSLVRRNSQDPRTNELVFRVDTGAAERSLQTAAPDLARDVFLVLALDRSAGETEWWLASSASRTQLVVPQALKRAQPHILDLNGRRAIGIVTERVGTVFIRKPFLWRYPSEIVRVYTLPADLLAPYRLDAIALIARDRLLCGFVRGDGQNQDDGLLFVLNLETGTWKKVGDYMLQATSASNRVLLLGQPWIDDRRWIVWLR